MHTILRQTFFVLCKIYPFCLVKFVKCLLSRILISPLFGASTPNVQLPYVILRIEGLPITLMKDVNNSDVYIECKRK